MAALLVSKGRSLMLRAAFVLILLTGLGLVGSGVPTVSAQEVASVTVYLTECPAGFDGESQADLYSTCYGNPVTGQAFSAQQGKSSEVPAVGTTDESGQVSLPLYGGSTTLSEGLPLGIAEYFVFCSHEDGSPIAFDYTGDTFGIFLEMEGGDYYGQGSHIHCDWYNIPSANGSEGREGTLSIYRVACPPGYEGDAYYDDCYDNPTAGAEFGIRQQGTDVGVAFTTGPDGAARTGLLLATPGTLVVTETTGVIDDGQPLPYLDYVVVCTRNGGEPVEIDYGQPNVMDIVFDAAPDDAIVCDWFYIAPATGANGDSDETVDGTRLTVYVTACPEEYTGDAYYPDCYDYPVTDVTVTAYRLKEDFSARATTGADGLATLSIPDSSIYDGVTLTTSANVEVPGGADPPFVVYCTDEVGDVVPVRYNLIQLDPGGDAYDAAIEDLPAGDVRCDWYLLTAADKGDEEEADGDVGGPIVVLPNTGAGAIDGRRDSPLASALPVALALLVGAAGTLIATEPSGFVRRTSAHRQGRASSAK